MRVLIADDDPFSATLLERLVQAAGHRALIVADGSAAWEILQGADAPRIVLLDWMMPGIDGLDLCRRIRELGRAEYTYVAILSAKNKQRDISLGFQAGADDFITKPYKIDEVLARLGVAERLIQSITPGATLREAIAEARTGAGGDVIVRSGGRVGRIIFHQGQIAWAHLSSEPGSLMAMLAGVDSISREEIKGVIEECTETGANFADVIVSWGLLTREHLRSLMVGWIRAKIRAIAALPLARVIFSPESRAYASEMLFSAEEVIDAGVLGPSRRSAIVEGAASLGAPPEGDVALTNAIMESLDQAIQIDGARSAAVFDLRGGACLGARGEDVDLDLVWSKLRLATMSDLWEELEDIMISTQRYIYILRPLRRDPPYTIFLAIDRATTKIGLVRRALAECTIAETRQQIARS